MKDNSILSTSSLKVSYGTTTALNNVTFQIQKGGMIGVLGSNGCGKTTLLKALAGLLRGYDGKIWICDRPLSWKTNEFTCYHGGTQFYLPSMRISEMINLYRNFFADFSVETAVALCSSLKLDTRQYMNSLSRGQCSQVLFGLSFSRDAKVFLLDEPFAHMDATATDFMKKIVINALTPKKAILLATHDINEIEKLFDQILVLKDGEVVLFGFADDLRETYGKTIKEIVKEIM